MRIPLNVNTKIELINDYTRLKEEYTITELCGVGASSIVYNGVTYNNEKVRIKEYYPLVPSCDRDDSLRVYPIDDEESFEINLKQFIVGFEYQNELRNYPELTNSIIPTNSLCSANGTKYIITTNMEGVSLDKSRPDTLFSMLKNVLALSKVISAYHKNGYLHLDIKPSNIFRIPETDEHIMLFDFNSIVRADDIKEGKCPLLSYSPRWAAPEQKQSKINKICESTDIYAIGALVFDYIFGREITCNDRSFSVIWDYKLAAKGVFDNVNPGIYSVLSEFLHKTLATNINRRYQTVDEVCGKLNELLELSDPAALFIYDNFSYNNRCFVGRRKEISDIKSILAKNQVVFLSGIGGIGKTSIALHYARENRDAYNNVVLVRYNGSIEKTIISDEIRINNFDIEEKDEKRLYNLKLEKLKDLFKESDLFILDNFDEDNEEELNELMSLLDCRCKFIVTSREDFRDYNFCQIYVDAFNDRQDVLALFSEYMSRSYSEEEIISINNIIDIVEWHTMTVELVSKYLNISEDSPSQLEKRLREQEGITNIGETNVKHRKDKRISNTGVDKHLRILFDFSSFTDVEKEVMMSLSLLGSVRISYAFFDMLFFNENKYKEALNTLIKYGWVQCDFNSEKISLHQIIMDLIYNDFKPTTENCGLITKGIINYMSDADLTMIQRDMRKRLYNGLIERISGENEDYIEICMFSDKVDLIDKAKTICKSIQDVSLIELYYKLCIRQMTLIGKEAYDPDDDNIDSILYDIVIKIIMIYKEAYSEISAEENMDKQILYYWNLSDCLYNIASDLDSTYYIGDGRKEYLDILYKNLTKLYDYIIKCMPNTSINVEQKGDIIAKIKKFYVDEDFACDYKTQYYIDKFKGDCLDDELESLYNDGFTGIEPSVVIDGQVYRYKEKHSKVKRKVERIIDAISYSDIGLYFDKKKRDISIKKEQWQYERAHLTVIKELKKKGVDKEEFIYYCAKSDAMDAGVEKQILIWDDAARRYNYSNYLLYNKCISNVITLIEKEMYKDDEILNKKFNDGYMTWWDYYWNSMLGRIHCYDNLHNYNDMKKDTEKLYKIMLDYHEKKWLFDEVDVFYFSLCLNSISRWKNVIGEYDNSCFIDLSRIILKFDVKMFFEKYRDYYCIISNINEFYKNIYNIIKNEINLSNIDWLETLYRFQSVLSYTDYSENIEPFIKLITDAIEKYKKMEVDFKNN